MIQIMKKMDRTKAERIFNNLVAPCGMNCRLCWGYIREKNKCPGCLKIDSQENQKSKYRTTCKIRNCEQIAKSGAKYCSVSCHSFPCLRLKQLDKRYRTKYAMSMIDNLKMINEVGIRHFIQNEAVKWICSKCGAAICVHKPICLSCGHKWHEEKTE